MLPVGQHPWRPWRLWRLRRHGGVFRNAFSGIGSFFSGGGGTWCRISGRTGVGGVTIPLVPSRQTDGTAAMSAVEEGRTT